MKISIIVPFFNNQDTINETIESVVNQTSSDWELILVDDGSSDKSHHTACRFANTYSKKIRIVKRPISYPKGANACRNFGAEISKYELLIFLDADDLLSSNCVELRLNQIKSKYAPVTFFRMLPFKSYRDLESNKYRIPMEEMNLFIARNRFFNYDLPWNTTSGLWDKKFFFSIGGFDKTLTRLQDYDLHIKTLISNRSDEIIFYPQNRFDFYYRKSIYHRRMTLTKKKEVYYQLLLIQDRYRNYLQYGFYRYLFKNYANCIRQTDAYLLKRLKNIDRIRYSILRNIHNQLLYRVIRKLIF